MDLATFHELLTPAGQAASLEAAALAPTEATFLADFEKLRKRYPPTLAKAALETALLGRGARASSLTRTACTSPARRSNRRPGMPSPATGATRFAPFGTVADLCCGIGGDALALASEGLTVDAVESDPLRLAMAEANASALGLADRIAFHAGRALAVPLPDAAPRSPTRTGARRRAGTSTRKITHRRCRPFAARFRRDFPLAVKIAPGVAWADVAHLGAEAEFVSVGGELKECVLWFGALRTVERRATLLPGGADTRRRMSRRRCRPSFRPESTCSIPTPPSFAPASLVNWRRNWGSRPSTTPSMLLTADRPVASPFVTSVPRRVRGALQRQPTPRLTCAQTACGRVTS